MSDELKKGDKVRWNYWTDRRESGWFHGVVVAGPSVQYGKACYKIEYQSKDGAGDYRSWKVASLLKRDGQ